MGHSQIHCFDFFFFLFCLTRSLLRYVRQILDSHLDVLVSYNFDTFGMTLIEAEAAGVPVFFCDPDMQEVVPKGGFAQSSDPSPEAMAEALNHLIANPGQIHKMSEIMIKHRHEILISNRIQKLIKLFSALPTTK